MTTTFFDTLLALRTAIARIGENDWLRWWNSEALGPAGRYAAPRVFKRAPELAAAHMSILAARARHDGAVPKERLVHLFNLGEEAEGAFERWLIQRKAAGWTPAPLPDPAPDQRESAASALRAVGIEPAERQQGGTNGFLVLGSVRTPDLEGERGRTRLVAELAAAYAAAAPGHLVIPYFRWER